MLLKPGQEKCSYCDPKLFTIWQQKDNGLCDKSIHCAPSSGGSTAQVCALGLGENSIQVTLLRGLNFQEKKSDSRDGD